VVGEDRHAKVNQLRPTIGASPLRLLSSAIAASKLT
jgi:hypothetical protein